MNDNALKALWHGQEWQPPTDFSDSELIARMNAKMRRFDRDIFWRDIRELSACVFIACFFGPGLFRSASPLSHAGSALLVASSIFIATVLVIARRLQKRRNAFASVREFITDERNKVARQRSLLKSVVWWYLLPIYLGVALFVMGSSANLVFKLTFIIVYAFVCVLIYFVNQRAVQKRLSPLVNELDQLLQTLPGSAEPPMSPEEN
jgi:hypothetical protein